MIKNAIRYLTPYGIVKQHQEAWLKGYNKVNFERQEKVIRYLMDLNSDDPEIIEIVDFLKNYPISVFPYDFQFKYPSRKIEAHLDSSCQLNFVLHEGKRMYFPKGRTIEQCKNYYNGLLSEQDPDSPHRYETDAFHVCEGDVLADIGAAEGIFALSNIEKVKKAYLFECNQKWIEALKKTFEPWKEKVTIVNKYISDTTDGNCVSVDDFFDGKEVNFIKADIEGFEVKLLLGAKNILKTAGGGGGISKWFSAPITVKTMRKN